MRGNESEDPKAWFAKGEEDLLAARILGESGRHVTNMVCYHCQQCAEKYLKGYLKWRNGKFKWVHDLVYLVDLCGEWDEEFRILQRAAEVLTRSAELSRYPGDDDPATAEEVSAALATAEQVRELVLRKTGG